MLGKKRVSKPFPWKSASIRQNKDWRDLIAVSFARERAVAAFASECVSSNQLTSAIECAQSKCWLREPDFLS